VASSRSVFCILILLASACLSLKSYSISIPVPKSERGLNTSSKKNVVIDGSMCSDPLILNSTAAIQFRKPDGSFQTFCSGFITRPFEIMSAGHCFSGRAQFMKKAISQGNIFVRMNGFSDPIKVTGSSEQYSKNPTDFRDMAILNIAQRGISGPRMKIGKLEDCDENLPFTLAGYGTTESGRTSDQLKCATILTPAIRKDGPGAPSSTIQGPEKSDGKVCDGDSGGPVVCVGKDGQMKIVALISAGLDPAELVLKKNSWIALYRRYFESQASACKRRKILFMQGLANDMKRACPSFS